MSMDQGRVVDLGPRLAMLNSTAIFSDVTPI